MSGLLTTLALTSSSFAATLNVGPGQAYTTIGAAVAASNPHDTVLIALGHYNESVTVDHHLMLIAEQGIGDVYWTGTHGPTLTTTGESMVRVEGMYMTHTHGRCIDATNTYLEVVDVEFEYCGTPAVDGGAIRTAAHSSFEVRDSYFFSGTGNDGAFLHLSGSGRIQNSIFFGGVAQGDGGAVHFTGKSLRLHTSQFGFNQAQNGGAIFAHQSEQVYIVGSLLSGNSASNNGGAVWGESTNGWVDLYHSSLCQNDATQGGALHHDAEESWIFNSLFAANFAHEIGGAARMVNVDPMSEVSNNVFTGNQAFASAGGLESDGSLLVVMNVFADNQPTGWDTVGSPVHTHNLYWPDAAALQGATQHASDIVADPMFEGALAGPCGIDVHPQAGSPLIDAGDPAYHPDGDHSLPDIGIYGTGTSPEYDDDGDGTPHYYDCDDDDADLHLNALEVCNGRDDDCWGEGDFDFIDGATLDLTTASILYYDWDNDGHGAANEGTVWLCDGVDSLSSLGDDCDNADPANFPGNHEICDGQDNDCDLHTPDPGTYGPFWPDVDGDGQGDATLGEIFDCFPPAHYVDNDHDCDDSNPHVFYGATEVCDGMDTDCDGHSDEGLQQLPWYQDLDHDGYGDTFLLTDCAAPPNAASLNGDCDDTDANNHPTGTEQCDGQDNNCDLQADEGLSFSDWYLDQDGDSFGSGPAVATCDGAPTHHVANHADCNDNDGQIGSSIEFHADADMDGFGDPAHIAQACTAPPGFILPTAADCNDGDSAIHPTNRWYLDHDGDGAGTPSDFVESCQALEGRVRDNTDCNDNDASVQGEFTLWPDLDLDGYGAGTAVTACADSTGFVDNDLDCDDHDANANPDAVWYADTDMDGHGNPDASIAACLQPAGHVALDDDCLDTDDTRHPDTPWYADTDADGLGDISDVVHQCANPGARVRNADDCSDASASIGAATDHWPDTDFDGFGDGAEAAIVTCPMTGMVQNDQDCDDTDATLSPTTAWYPDADGDLSGAVATPTQQCEPPNASSVRNTGDCDDQDAHRSPLAPELCDNIDNDCDGLFDDADEPVDPLTWFLDDDGDGYGTAHQIQACVQPSGYANAGHDCADENPLIHPNAAELCDGLDNDCNPHTGDDTTELDWYADSDGDGWGTSVVVATQCASPGQASLLTGDCDDAVAGTNPEAVEVCDGHDNDCDVHIDEDATGQLPYWPDLDADGFGANGSLTVFACAAPAHHSGNDRDCNDASDTDFPGAPELCDGHDNDCNTLVDDNAVDAPESYPDFDGDDFGNGDGTTVRECEASTGRTFDHTDCNDSNAAAYPGAPEVCDSFDNNCDGHVDEGLLDLPYWLDGDQDGFGNPDLQTLADGCVVPPFTVDNDADCDDNDPAVNPHATEIAGNGIDDDCDGLEEPGPTPPPSLPATVIPTEPGETDPPVIEPTPVEGPGLWFCASAPASGLLPMLLLPLFVRRRR